MDSIVKSRIELTPLKNSFTVDDIEGDLKQVFLDLFDAYIADMAGDVNALGMAHLGSLDLVKRSVNMDGLVLIQNNRSEASNRRLYRAWKSRNTQGRGLHFLKAYLQILFPNSWVIDQLMQVTATPYPTALLPQKYYGDDADKFLTSRLKIWISAQGENAGSVGTIARVIKDIIPARMVPEINLSESSSSVIRINSVFTCWQFVNTEGTTK